MQKASMIFQISKSALAACCAMGLAVAAPALAGHDPGYVVVDLGTLGGETSIALALNNNEQVVGHSTDAGGNWRAFIWQDDQMSDLGMLDGYAEMFGHGLNDLGDAFGQAVSSDGTSSRPFAWVSGNLIDLGTIGGSHGAAYDGNDARTVVGYSTRANGRQRAFRWSQNQMVDLGTLPGDVESCAKAINNNGVIVGWSADDEGQKTAVYWINDVITSMGTIRGGLWSEATAINDAGIIVGISDYGDGHHAFWYQDDAMVDLGSFPVGGDSRAHGVSIRGEVVGDAILPAIEALQAVVWNAGVIKNINSLVPPFSEWDTLITTRAINDTAHTVGQGRLLTGEEHAFILLPKLGLGNPVPGQAGMVNLFDATGATPNARIYLVYAFTWGDTPVPGCPGVRFGVRNPSLVGSTRADDTGHALYEVFVPGAARGRPILMQVVESGSCDISTVLVWNFE